MPSTTTNIPQPHLRGVFLVLMCALLLFSAAQAAPALAATEFTGGPIDGDYPLCVSNDHSVYALRFAATAGLRDKDSELLTTTGSYYVKVRISPTPAPGGGNSRGFTWNPTSGEWVQERDDWSKFPVVTTTASGTITKDESGWIFFKFGDTTKPTTQQPNPWYIIVSLLPTDATVDGRTNNSASATAPAVTILDSTGSLSGVPGAFRIHNGVATGAAADKRVEADASGGTDVWAVSRTEDNGVEDYGTTETGDFGLAVPVDAAFDAKIQNAIWPVAAGGFTGTVTGADIALGGADTTPPDAPANFTVTSSDGAAHLEWDAVPGADSYTVYWWQDPTPIDGTTNYTSRHVPLATVTGTPTYDAPALTNGETYYFEVRADDAAGNVSPPSAEGAATPQTTSALTLQTSATVVNWNAAATLSGELTDGLDPFTAGQQINVESSVDGGTTWTVVKAVDPVSATEFTYSVNVIPRRATQYRFSFTGDAAHTASVSPTVTVTPRVGLGKPVAPKTVKKGKRITAWGTLKPRQTAGTRTVRIRCYKKVAGKWQLKKTVAAKNADYKSYSKYSARIRFSSKGSWKLVASSAATERYEAKTSGARYVKVK